MKNAFTGKARYPDLSSGYGLYLRRSCNTKEVVTQAQYNRIVKKFCKGLADRLAEKGMVDLPCDIGMLAMTKRRYKPKFNEDGKIHSWGRVDWKETKKLWEENPDARENRQLVRSTDRFGYVLAFAPKRVRRHANFRCLGYRANRALYRKMVENISEKGYVIIDFDSFVQ